MESAISDVSPESSMAMAFLQDQTAATAIEYGLIAALVSTVIIGAITVIGTTLSGTFTTISTALANN
jgi:pilus assembly protein Flp/PilA